MFNLKSLKNKNEPILEPLFRNLRFLVGQKDLLRILSKTSRIFDYGCGPEAKFHKYLASTGMKFKFYCGYDPLLKKDVFTDKLLLTSSWKKLKKEKFDLVAMFALLEHVPYPDFDFKPIFDLLKKDGYLILTTPTPLSKPVLEFLSFRLGIVSRREIEEHQHYYTLDEIENLFSGYGLKVVSKCVFEIGMNNYVLLQKK